ncbi:hypothetical protein [Mumia zhuanghuii]|nr:hypothetical protein [Mumia zhuanghuii]
MLLWACHLLPQQCLKALAYCMPPMELELWDNRRVAGQSSGRVVLLDEK